MADSCATTFAAVSLSPVETYRLSTVDVINGDPAEPSMIEPTSLQRRWDSAGLAVSRRLRKSGYWVMLLVVPHELLRTRCLSARRR